MKQAHRLSNLTDRLAALCDPIRLRVLRLLERNELSVGELGKILQLPQSTVSRHLKTLTDGGWLHKRAEGTATLYRLVFDDLPPESRSLWLVAREQLSEVLDLAEDQRRLASVLAERRADTEGFFGRVAGQWDVLRGELFGSRFTTAGLLGLLPRTWKVADLGCGTGNVAELLAPHVQRVVAIDQSPAMLKAARKRLGSISNVDLVRAELDSIPLESGSVDAAVCCLVFHHLESPLGAAKEMHRILRPGGTALVVDMLEHDRTSYRHTMGHRWLGFSPARIQSILTEAGFQRPFVSVIAGEADAKGPGLFSCSAHASE
ncbi:MAG: ArsR family transcriptional regulator [Phycisphaerae bacterium]|nr:ArsR family transcriptional regulator [Phycisphaerae bacterium]